MDETTLTRGVPTAQEADVTNLSTAPLRLGEVVRSRRLELGLTQKEVARQMRETGFSTWSSSKMGAVDIGDRGTINIRELWALSVILDFDVTDVFPRRGRS